MERAFRTSKGLFATRPIFHKLDETVRGHVSCSFLALVLKKELEDRIATLREQEELDAIRPELDGRQVMDHLGLAPGPEVGHALEFLLELRLEEGPLGEEEARRRLDAWGSERRATG